MKKIIGFLFCFLLFLPLASAKNSFNYFLKSLQAVDSFYSLLQEKAPQEKYVTLEITPFFYSKLPQKATNVPFLILDFKSFSSEDVLIKEIKVHHKGLGLLADITAVKAFDGITHYGTKPSFSEDNTTTIRFASDPIVIPAFSEKEIKIVVDIDAQQSGGEHKIYIEDISDIKLIGADTDEDIELK